MIFLFERDDVYAERRLHNIPLNHTVIIKRVGPELKKGSRHYLHDPKDPSNPATEPMKRRKLAQYLNANGYCPLEFRHIANDPKAYLNAIAEKAIAGYKAVPRYLWTGALDPRTRRPLHRSTPPENYNCRCVAHPIIIDPKKMAAATSLHSSLDASAFFGESQPRVTELSGLMATHQFVMKNGNVFFGHYVKSGMGSEVWCAVASELVRMTDTKDFEIFELNDPIPFDQLKPGPITSIDAHADLSSFKRTETVLEKAIQSGLEKNVDPFRNDAPEDATHWYRGGLRCAPCWIKEDVSVSPVMYEMFTSEMWLHCRPQQLRVANLVKLADLPVSD